MTKGKAPTRINPGVQSIPTASVRIDGGTQQRHQIRTDVACEYMDVLIDGGELPPIIVYYDGNDYWLVDGYHRLEAHRRAKREVIAADVRKGSLREAILASVGANAAHGLQRSPEDKRKAVRTLLLDEEWSQWSDRAIAAACNVSGSFVGDERRRVTAAGCSRPPEEANNPEVRKGQDGRTYNVSGLQSRPSNPATQEPEAPAELDPETAAAVGVAADVAMVLLVLDGHAKPSIEVSVAEVRRALERQRGAPLAGVELAVALEAGRTEGLWNHDGIDGEAGWMWLTPPQEKSDVDTLRGLLESLEEKPFAPIRVDVSLAWHEALGLRHNNFPREALAHDQLVAEGGWTFVKATVTKNGYWHRAPATISTDVSATEAEDLDLDLDDPAVQGHMASLEDGDEDTDEDGDTDEESDEIEDQEEPEPGKASKIDVTNLVVAMEGLGAQNDLARGEPLDPAAVRAEFAWVLDLEEVPTVRWKAVVDTAIRAGLIRGEKGMLCLATAPASSAETEAETSAPESYDFGTLVSQVRQLLGELGRVPLTQARSHLEATFPGGTLPEELWQKVLATGVREEFWAHDPAEIQHLSALIWPLERTKGASKRAQARVDAEVPPREVVAEPNEQEDASLLRLVLGSMSSGLPGATILGREARHAFWGRASWSDKDDGLHRDQRWAAAIEFGTHAGWWIVTDGVFVLRQQIPKTDASQPGPLGPRTEEGEDAGPSEVLRTGDGGGAAPAAEGSAGRVGLGENTADQAATSAAGGGSEGEPAGQPGAAEGESTGTEPARAREVAQVIEASPEQLEDRATLDAALLLVVLRKFDRSAVQPGAPIPFFEARVALESTLERMDQQEPQGPMGAERWERALRTGEQLKLWRQEGELLSLAGSKRGQRAKFDAYYTPVHVARACVRFLRDRAGVFNVNPSRDGTAIEPCVGGGAWVSAMREVFPTWLVDRCDIDPQVAGLAGARRGKEQAITADWLTWKGNKYSKRKEWDLCLGNRPYDGELADWVEASLQRAEVVAFLERETITGSIGRAKWFETHKPTHVAKVVQRILWEGPGAHESSDFADHVLIVWVKRQLDTDYTEFCWIDAQEEP